MTKPAPRPERQILLALMVISGTLLLVVLAQNKLDTDILLAFRTGSDPVGPMWVEEFARDITALGSLAVLALLITGSVLFLFMARLRTDALTMLAATVGGIVVVIILKAVLARERPDELIRSVHVWRVHGSRASQPDTGDVCDVARVVCLDAGRCQQGLPGSSLAE
jgi:hypothetical protein